MLILKQWISPLSNFSVFNGARLVLNYKVFEAPHIMYLFVKLTKHVEIYRFFHFNIPVLISNMEL